MRASASSLIVSGIFTVKPLLGGTFVFPSAVLTFCIDIFGIFACSSELLLSACINSDFDEANCTPLDFIFVIIPDSKANVKASFSNIRRFSAPVFSDSIARVFFPLLAPITLDFKILFALLFNASENSCREPPFHLKVTVLSEIL